MPGVVCQKLFFDAGEIPSEGSESTVAGLPL
jgi:hypothetical protein